MMGEAGKGQKVKSMHVKVHVLVWGPKDQERLQHRDMFARICSAAHSGIVK